MSWFGRRTSESPRPDTFEHFTAPYSPDVDLSQSPHVQQPANPPLPIRPIALPVNAATSSSKRPIMSFSVGKIPGAELVFTNYVYIHPQHSNLLKYADRPNYVLLNQSHVFIVQASDRLEPNVVGMNTKQRDSIGVAESEPIAVQAYKVSKEESAGLLRVKADISQVKQRRVTLKEVDVSQHLQKFYSGQLLTRGQVFVADVGIGAVYITVRSLEAANHASRRAERARRGDGRGHQQVRGARLDRAKHGVGVGVDRGPQGAQVREEHTATSAASCSTRTGSSRTWASVV